MVDLSARTTDVEVVTRGSVTSAGPTYARRRIGNLIDLEHLPVLAARVTLTMAADPARQRPALAEVELDVNGRVVRAHVAGRTMQEAIDVLQQRLRDRLQHLAEKDRSRRHRDDRLALRPEWSERPMEDRQLVRTKSFTMGELTTEEAAFDLESLDHDFLLFRDLEGHDAVVERADDAYRVTVARPVLAVADAVERLGAGGERWLFFTNADTGRGNVLYERFDGDYGLVTPAA
jgi:ribosome-associated translation inhibitor RaiA